ncbi:sigma-E processing peptidase SpoIIGA [Acetonema longum]|uniref:Sporulation sigma-E factor-processing peptidase n=1 Tax=Acetonema longum DSM 6540 TaxID=1009370 RepID=F7NMZ9_9FIRM|nr:sigma-E processing peptidase SpoIIGA [Acetonema longum]EGO62577.1 sigma-E processing peptidase SpoIIGA [Acetonema longum DSM 6540]
MIIYIDVILALNMVLNGVVLHFTAHVLGLRYSLFKIALAAAIGSLYALGLFIEALAVLYCFPWRIILPLVVLTIAFGKMPWKKFILTAVVYHSISFFLGGTVLAYSYLTLSGPGREFWGYTSGSVQSVNYQQLLGGGICGCIILQTFARRIVERVQKQDLYYNLKIIYDNQRATVRALLDTGNGLHSIAGHKPVVLADFQAIESLLGQECLHFLQNMAPGSWVEQLDRCPDAKWLSRVEVIPCRHVGGNSCFIGFRPDKIELLTKDGLLSVTEVVIGIYPGHLDRNLEYVAILHPAVLHNTDLLAKEV